MERGSKADGADPCWERKVREVRDWRRVTKGVRREAMNVWKKNKK